MNILHLPHDILLWILSDLPLAELATLSATCKDLHELVNQYGWNIYLRDHPRPSFSLAKSREIWSARLRVRYDTLVDRKWPQYDFLAQPLSSPWKGKLQPVMKATSSRLIVAAGSTLFSYLFGTSPDGRTPPISFEGSCSVPERDTGNRDITSCAVLSEDPDTSILVGFYDGSLCHVRLDSRINELEAYVSPGYFGIHGGATIEHLDSQGTLVLSLSSDGKAALSSSSSSLTCLSTIDLGQRSWTSHLCMDSPSPFAAFGTSSATPLAIHSIRNEELSPNPTYVPSVDSSTSAVYSITRAPLSCAWGSSQILVSGWYDGQVRCYDLRESNPRSILSVADPWSFEPIYSVSCGGGSANHIAAGSARHSVVSFWDVRYPSKGWSVHAPGNDSSPVYEVILESSRLFGATQSRPFVYDFGPDAASISYPSLPRNYKVQGLKRSRNGAGYYVTKYHHEPYYNA